MGFIVGENMYVSSFFLSNVFVGWVEKTSLAVTDGILILSFVFCM